MNPSKGFSLIEVLISLTLVLTVILVLSNQQNQLKQWLLRFRLRAQASHYLDQIDESLWIDLFPLPVLPSPYDLVLEKNKNNLSLHLTWFSGRDFILRQHPLLHVQHE